MPTTYLILTVVGPDRAGLVDALSEQVREHGGNWLESRMAKLAGHFAGVVRISVPHERSESLRSALARLADVGLAVSVTAGDDAPDPAPPRKLTLSLVGHDRPGIVRDLAHALAAHGVNITELATRVSSAPMSGEPLFHADATVTAPADAAMEQVHDDLERLAAQLGIDLAVHEA